MRDPSAWALELGAHRGRKSQQQETYICSFGRNSESLMPGGNHSGLGDGAVVLDLYSVTDSSCSDMGTGGGGPRDLSLLSSSSSQHAVSDNKSIPLDGRRKQQRSRALGNPLEGTWRNREAQAQNAHWLGSQGLRGAHAHPILGDRPSSLTPGKEKPRPLPVAPEVRMCNFFLASGVQTARPAGESESPFNPRHGLTAKSWPIPHYISVSGFGSPSGAQETGLALEKVPAGDSIPSSAHWTLATAQWLLPCSLAASVQKEPTRPSPIPALCQGGPLA